MKGRDKNGRFIKGFPHNKGMVVSKETKKKISKTLTGKKNPEHSKRLVGRKLSDETKNKMSISQKRIGNKPPTLYGKNHGKWKGDSAGYRAIHTWVKNHFGKADVCKKCQSTKNIEWANISHEYKRIKSDWIKLCCKCHKKFDKKSKGAIKRRFNYV